MKLYPAVCDDLGHHGVVWMFWFCFPRSGNLVRRSPAAFDDKQWKILPNGLQCLLFRDCSSTDEQYHCRRFATLQPPYEFEDDVGFAAPGIAPDEDEVRMVWVEGCFGLSLTTGITNHTERRHPDQW